MQRFEPHVFPSTTPLAGAPVGSRWLPLALALLMAACVHSPQAAVPELQPAEVHVASPCSETPSARAAL